MNIKIDFDIWKRNRIESFVVIPTGIFFSAKNKALGIYLFNVFFEFCWETSNATK